MKKSYCSVSDVKNENVEGTRRLYRAISDVARSLDESRDRAKSCTELFLPNVEAQRVKLRDYCERLIFTDPIGYGRKGEELLWRKAYYEVVAAAKRLRKNNAWSPEEEAHVEGHLFAGVGHYHHLILRLQIEFRLDLGGTIDFPLSVTDGGLAKGKLGPARGSRDAAAGAGWALQAVLRCLVFLGDLSRYLLELHPHWDCGNAQRYYLQALSLNADAGMPHNQLGTLAGNGNYGVDAAYHYMRCLTCLQTFDGAEGNLRRIFERNAKWLDNHNRWKLDKVEDMPPTERIHFFIAKFLVVVDVWFFDKIFPANPSQLCQEMVEDLRHCLQFTKHFPSDSNLSPEQLDLDDLLSYDAGSENNKPEYMKDDLVFKLVSMLLLCIMRLHAKRSKLLSGTVTFTLAVMSELVQQVIEHIQDSVLSLSLTSATPTSPIPECSPPGKGKGPTPAPVPPSVACSNGSEEPKPLTNGTVSPVVNGVCPTEEKKTKKKKMKYLHKFRRRRRPKVLVHHSSEESDYSDGDLPFVRSSSSDDGNEDISETDEHLALSYDEDEDEDSEESLVIAQAEPKEPLENHKDSNCDDDNNKTLTNGTCEPEPEPNTSAPEAECEGRGLQNGAPEERAEPQSGAKERPQGPTDPADVIELVAEEGLLQAVRVCADWLRSEADVLGACGRSSPTLMTRLATVLNLIRVDADELEKRKESAKFFKLNNIGEIYEKVPLPEDVKLKGVALLKETHDLIDWNFCNNRCLHLKEEALVRVYKLVGFGRFLAGIEDTRIHYDEVERLFAFIPSAPDTDGVCAVNGAGKAAAATGASPNGGSPSQSPSPGPGGPVVVLGRSSPARAPGAGGGEQMMQHMGRLWLRAQVHELETRVQRRGRAGAALSPYLAVECDALTAHLPLVKQLVAARRFILLIPAVVVSALDELKREVGRAREAIRWLEAQFQRGNRFLRAQRQHERLPLPLIKYPKKKDREAWFFFQVVECCYYFTQQNNVHELPPETSLVTLLTGQRVGPDDSGPGPAAPSRSYSPLGVARSAGVNLEHIQAFHAKWKTSSKSHG